MFFPLTFFSILAYQNRYKLWNENIKGMNGDQGTRNNAFPNVLTKNYHSQGIIFSSLPFFPAILFLYIHFLLISLVSRMVTCQTFN